VSSPEVEVGVERAAALVELRRFDEAIAHCRNVLASHATHLRAHCLLAQSELGRRHHRDALSAAQQAIAIAPDEEWPHRLASLAHAGLRDTQRALEHAREAVRLAPHEYRTYIRLVEAELDGGSVQAAGSATQRALELAPEIADVQFVAGKVADAEGRPGAAQEAFRRALSIQPDHSAAHNELARMQLKDSRRFRGGALAGAATGFATAPRADPRSDVSKRNLEIVLHRFLRTTAYLVFLGAALGWLTASNDPSEAARIAPLIVLALPLIFAARFCVALTSQLRRYLRDAILRRSELRKTALLELAASACLVAEALSSHQVRGLFAVGAWFLAIGARLVLWNHHPLTNTS
jgi:tetratricopeptide (TPR) repeat protein